jgi:GNAT superfamily N-acetyltransferase
VSGARRDFLCDKLLYGEGIWTLVLQSGGSVYDESGVEVVGALTLHARSTARGRYAELTTCAVARSLARRGFGTVLARWAELLAAVEGIECLLVAGGHDALSFWEALGFREPPARVPAEWCDALRRKFDNAKVLHLPLHRTRGGGGGGVDSAHEASLEQAIAQLRPPAAGARPSKRQRA